MSVLFPAPSSSPGPQTIAVDFPIDSRVTEVTVYFDGAIVTRVFDGIQLKAGRTIVNIAGEGLPLNLEESLVKIGKTGDVQIGKVSLRDPMSIELRAAQATTTSLTMIYGIHEVTWGAFYEIRVDLNPSNGSAHPTANVLYTASVAKHTAEDWVDAKHFIATGNRPQSFPSPTNITNNTVETMKAQEWTYPIKQSGEIIVGCFDLDATVLLSCAPRRSSDVHREVRMTNNSKFLLAPGKSAIYVNGDFITHHQIDNIRRGESFVCPLGIDPEVLVTSTHQSDLDLKISVLNTRNSLAYVLILDNVRYNISAKAAVLDEPRATVRYGYDKWDAIQGLQTSNSDQVADVFGSTLYWIHLLTYQKEVVLNIRWRIPRPQFDEVLLGNLPPIEERGYGRS